MIFVETVNAVFFYKEVEDLTESFRKQRLKDWFTIYQVSLKS